MLVSTLRPEDLEESGSDGAGPGQRVALSQRVGWEEGTVSRVPFSEKALTPPWVSVGQGGVFPGCPCGQGLSSSCLCFDPSSTK